MRPIYIASCSFGKDSIATILLALEHNEPLDRALFSEVMFDNKCGISGEIPEHINWIYDFAIPQLASMGVKVDVVRSEKDYVWFFQNAVRCKGKYQGKLYGFPIGGKCIINRELKLGPIRSYLRQFDNEIIQYVGIAADEPLRLARLKGNQVSLLDKYGYTEGMAKELCQKYNLLSPIYKTGNRGGCFFCPNSGFSAFKRFREQHPDLWNSLLQLAKTPNLCSYGFKYGMTLEEVNAKLDSMEKGL